MFEKGLERKENKKFKKLLEDSVVFFDVDNFKNQKKKNSGKTSSVKEKKSYNKTDIRPKSGLREENKNNTKEKDINLIPENISTIPPQTKRLAFLLIGIFLVIFINALLYVNLLKYKISLNENINKILESNEKINKEYLLEKSSLDQYKLIKEKIDIVDELLKGHIHWTYVIDLLKDNVINNVDIKSISGSTSGMIYLSMESKSYKDMADQINKFKSIEYVKGITINNAVSSNTGYGVNFDIGVEFDPKVFLSKE